MKIDKIKKLRLWRDAQAKQEGVEPYLVLSNQTIEEIANSEIKNKNDLLKIKGIKEKKLYKYGQAIWEILTGTGDVNRATEEIIEMSETGEKTFSVSVFLDLVNVGLRSFSVRVRGEVSGLSVRGGHYYFDLKDKEDGSVIACFLWKNNYAMFGVELREGLEVIISGFPSVYKPNGRLSFQVSGLELVGEGALKKQYEELKAKLTKEGLFAAERKRELPAFPETIGVITSKQGAVINDFLNNIGKFGFKIKLIDVRVEGAQAVPDILSAIKTFRKEKIDTLVIIRGGGTLESLQAFNNEMLVRAVSLFPKPVIVGIGHDKDVPLVSLVADVACSTPSIVAATINRSWEQARAQVDLQERKIINSFSFRLQSVHNFILGKAGSIQKNFQRLLSSLQEPAMRLREEFARLGQSFKNFRLNMVAQGKLFSSLFASVLRESTSSLDTAEKFLSLHNPARQLALGYSLLYKNGKIVRGIKGISRGDEIEVQLEDGKLYSEVIETVQNLTAYKNAK